MGDLFIIFLMSCIAFFFFAWDKHLAYFQRWRVPEFVLLLLTALGGAFGGLCAMIFFHHKTKHKAFLVCVPLFLALQCAVCVLLRVFGIIHTI